MKLNGTSYRTKKAIIWDWNGTLLNDIDVCIGSMNVLLQKRGLPVLNREYYQSIFTFPVKNYYRDLGFDFDQEPFEVPAMEFINEYYQKLYKAGLFSDVEEVLKHYQGKGYYQAILSAMEHDSLIESLKDTGIYKYFDKISGINDHYAHSKLENGIDLLKHMNIDASEIVLIGDTLHDFDVANDLKVDCIMVCRGHQSKERLSEKADLVFDNLLEVTHLIQ